MCKGTGHTPNKLKDENLGEQKHIDHRWYWKFREGIYIKNAGKRNDVSRIVIYSRDKKQWELQQFYPEDEYPQVRFFRRCKRQRKVIQSNGRNRYCCPCSSIETGSCSRVQPNGIHQNKCFGCREFNSSMPR